MSTWKGQRGRWRVEKGDEGKEEKRESKCEAETKYVESGRKLELEKKWKGGGGGGEG